MNHSEAEYITAGYKYERERGALANTAQAYVIRRMLESETPEDQTEARRLIAQGREEARRS